MDWFNQIIIFGVLAFFMFLLSAAFWKRRPKVGLLFGGLELLAAVLSTAPWMYALEISGKRDWFLLGLLGYPPVALIFYAMLITGIVCIVRSYRGIQKHPIAAKPAA